MKPRGPQYLSAKEVISEFKKKGLPENFCHVPFASLMLEPDGRVGSCRVKGTEFPVGNLHANTLEEIWNGPAIRKWRREFLSGDVSNCAKEVRHSRCHTCPQYNSLLDKIDLSEVQKSGPKRLTLNLNGHCNLECRMCHIWKLPNGEYQKHGWLEKAMLWAEQADEIELLSGEPFIQKDTYEIIDRVAKVNPNCQWSITTNCHWTLTPNVERQLDQIQFKHIIVSIDSLNPATYALIRKRGDLSVVLKNFDRLQAYEARRTAKGLSGLNIQVAFLIQKDNWDEIGNMLRFAEEKNVSLFFSFLYEPYAHSLLGLSVSEREGILSTYFSRLPRRFLIQSRKIFLPILDSLPPLSRASQVLELGKAIQNREIST